MCAQEVTVKLDTHVHTAFSGYSTIPMVSRLMRESYNAPRRVYECAKARGMDLVAITDHDVIDGALTIADRPDVIIGCEVTGVFPADGVRVHLLVLGISEAQHREIQRLRHDVSELLPYLKQERIFVSLNHVASRVNGRITGAHVSALIPWIDGLEIRNGSRLDTQNRTAACVAAAHRKVGVGGSDSHTMRGIGRTWVEAPFATSRQEFLDELHAGRVRVGGRQGSVLTMASDVVRMTSNIYHEHGRAFLERPHRWRRQVMAASLVVGAPLIGVPLVLSALHFLLEARFNRSLLRDMSKHPELRVPELA
jgi:predicted metal-dependent phosphoesterase TrpH